MRGRGSLLKYDFPGLVLYSITVIADQIQFLWRQHTENRRPATAVPATLRILRFNHGAPSKPFTLRRCKDKDKLI
jgi:hypothetical protein